MAGLPPDLSCLRGEYRSGADIGQDWWARGEFEGISFPKEYQGFFAGMFRVSDIEKVRMLPLLQVPDDRRYFRWFKTCECERHLRSRFCGCEDIRTSGKMGTKQASCWKMDELQAFHPVSPGMVEPLLEDVSAELYDARWKARVKYYPGLSKIAALDIANAGTRWYEAGKTEEALKAYVAAREFDPEEAVYPLRLGQVYLVRGELDMALQCFQDALRLQPLLPDTATKVDQLFEERKDSEARESFWRDVFSRHPDNWFAGTRLGGILESNGKWGEAAEVYRVRQINGTSDVPCLMYLGRSECEKAFSLLGKWRHVDYSRSYLSILLQRGISRKKCSIGADALVRARITPKCRALQN